MYNAGVVVLNSKVEGLAPVLQSISNSVLASGEPEWVVFVEC
jgi:hypothetical protein